MTPAPLRRIQHAATRKGLELAISATARLPIRSQKSVARSLVTLAGKIPALRRKVRENMNLALGEGVPAEAERSYFWNVGWSLSNALTVFHNGLLNTALLQEVMFDDTLRILDEAVAERRGVVLTAPHWTGHELLAACINHRHPMVMLVRHASVPEHTARKLKWYAALGVETVLRPSSTSDINEAMAYLAILKQRKMLAITPDLLTDSRNGVEVSIFGRSARLHAGAFALARMARAPMIMASGHWHSEANRALIRFERAPDFNLDDREAAVRAALQHWCRWFEGRLRANPENWLFWLDRRWSHFLRSVPRTLESS